MLAIHVLAMVFFFHVLPGDAEKDIRGPFHASNYIRPALVFSLPTIVFLAGISLAIGEWTRRPILVFVIPLGLVVTDVFFLGTWSPGWLDPRINRVLMLIEPGGARWLGETWLKVDRGVKFYNSAAIPYDLPFLISRLAFVGFGFGAVAAEPLAFRSARCAGAHFCQCDPRGRISAESPGRGSSDSAAGNARDGRKLGRGCSQVPGMLLGSSWLSWCRAPAFTFLSP